MKSQAVTYRPIGVCPQYSVSNTGVVIRTGSGLPIKSKVNPRGYLMVKLYYDGKYHSPVIHRLVAECFVANEASLPFVDHIDRNKLNNASDNLRWVSKSGNQRNMSKHKDGRSQFKGVSWHRRDGKWRARIYADGKDMFLGNYDSEIAAAAAYNKEALRHEGFSLNAIDDHAHVMGA